MELSKKELAKILICGTLALIIFGIDLLTPLGVAGGVPYVLVVLLSSWLPHRRSVFLAATLCTLLTCVGFELSPGGGEVEKIVANRLLAIFAIWVTAILVYQRRGVEEGLEIFNEKLEERIHASTKDLQEANARLSKENRDRKELERVLKRREEWSRALVDSIPHGIQEIDSSGVITFGNPAYHKMIGYGPGELSGMTIWDLLVCEEEKKALPEYLKHLVKNQPTPTLYLTKNWTKDGKIIDAQVAWAYKMNDKGEVVGFISVITDITEKKRAEVALKESESRYKAIVEDQTEFICRNKPNGIVTFVNNAYCQYFGIKPGEIVGKTFFSAIPQEDHEKIQRHFDSLGPDCPVETHEHRVIAQDGTIRWQRWTNRAILNEQGEVIEFQGSGHDITQEKETERALYVAQEELEKRVEERTFDLQEMNEQLRKFVEWQRVVRKEIQEKEIRYRTLFNQLPDGVVLIDPETALSVECNEIAPTLLGYTEEEFKKLRVLDYESAETKEEIEAHAARVIQRGGDSFETKLRTKDGQIRDFFVNITVVELQGKKFFHSILKDITERKLVEESLRLSEERYRLVSRATYDAIWDWDLLRDLREWNEGVQSLFRYSSDEIGPDVRWWKETIHPEDRERVVKGIQALIDSGQSHWSDEYRFRCADGTYAFVTDRGYVVHDETGKAIRMVGAMSDITERKRAEEASRESEAWLKTLTEAIPQLVWTAYPDGSLDYVNQQAIDYFERSFEELIGWGWTDGVHQDDLPRCLEQWGQAREQSVLYEIEYRLKKGGDNTYRWFMVRALPKKDHTGQIVQWFGTCTDITERKQAEMLKAEYLSKVLSVQEKERARIARELHDETGQALTFLLVGLRTLPNLRPLGKLKEKVEELRVFTLHTLEEVQRLAVGLHPRVLDDLGLRAAVEWYGREYSKKYGIFVDLDLNGIRKDRFSHEIEVSLYRILQEALTNISKHAQAEKVRVFLSCERSSVRMIIKDDGCGFKVHANGNSHIEAKRLGLHGMRERVSLMGGTIRFDSSPGNGTSVSVEVPIEKGA